MLVEDLGIDETNGSNHLLQTQHLPLHIPYYPHNPISNSAKLIKPSLILQFHRLTSSSPHPSHRTQFTVGTYSRPRKHCKHRTPQHTPPHNHPPRPHNLLIPQLPPQIPHQMPHPIEPVKPERQPHRKLQHPLHHRMQISKRFCKVHALEVPTEQGSEEVGGAEEVETPAEKGAGYTVEGGEVPG